ncbi:hypothetical protein P3T36_004595 [Kitasatospora sp. MAP12-15]|uniref:6-carboxytetrahydropterin synthase n=1 Tax=unclassified Kitasatospora TaxID=2633591 RepID=UPI0024756FBB|nr:6-carboxytetrahydropterin synthase [Kitasatospora sp. MAP12-44]MDH6111441.1 hypothetical protein [Kitasatospora sp. MAP12-44]
MTTTVALEVECEFTGTCSNPALPGWHYAHYVHGITVRAVLELHPSPEHTAHDLDLKRAEFGTALQTWADRFLNRHELNGVMRIENMSLERMAAWIYKRWAQHYLDLAAVRVQDSQDRSVWVTYRPAEA